MSADYPAAQEHLVPRDFMFNSNSHVAIVIHKTGGDATPQAVYNTFINSGNPGKSAHYAIGMDGSIWQFVPESLGAGANGITDGTTEAFWYPYMQQYGNLNTCTISIEHCDPSSRNDTPLTPAQKQASFALVAHLCQKYNIAADHIKPHRSIVSTACPGTYPMQELQNFIQQGGAPTVQTYSPNSADFNTWFTVLPDGRVQCKSTGKTLQGAIKNFVFSLSTDGQSLPIVGLPTTDEIPLVIGGKPMVLQGFERAWVWCDNAHIKANQPGTDNCALCMLGDPDFQKNTPGLFAQPVPGTGPVDTSAVVADIHAIADGIAPLIAKALVDIGKL